MIGMAGSFTRRERAGFEIGHTTQHADFPHCALLFASPQGLWDLSCRSGFRRWSNPWSTTGNEERRGESPGCRSNPDGAKYRADRLGGHIAPHTGKGVTPQRLMRDDGAGDLHVRHEGGSSSFRNFPAADSDLSLQTTTAAKNPPPELAAPIADSWGPPIRAAAESIRRYVFGR
jgi:hypothetical protein